MAVHSTHTHTRELYTRTSYWSLSLNAYCYGNSTTSIVDCIEVMYEWFCGFDWLEDRPSSFELHVAVYGACVVFEMQLVAGFNGCCGCIVLYYLHWQ